ncbi:MAG: Vps62-related protein [Actinobacteria bacterium]|nr:Vps62-related protein [Actinomycetota bacterium]
MAGDAELLERYVPFVQYDSMESFAADSVATMTDAVPAGFVHGNTLNAPKKAIAAARPGDGESQLGVDFLRGDTYPDPTGTAVRPKDHLDAVGKHYVADARAMHALPGYANHVYGFANRNCADQLWLQYWFFYYYNDKGLLGSGLHEGDWEMVQFRVGADGEPEVATYAQHTYAEKAAWADVEKEDGPGGPAPVVYSARGSHASYFRPGTYTQAPIIPDHNDDKGPRVRPQLTAITAAAPDWVAWPGRWGSTGHILKLPFVTIGADSPPGPRFHDAWASPCGFHERAKPAAELGPEAGAEVPKPAPPKVEARREGDRAVVDYQLPPPEPGVPKTKHLLISLDGHEDGKPPATYGISPEGESGEVTLPLELEDVDYTVRVASADRDDVTGPTTSAELPAA